MTPRPQGASHPIALGDAPIVLRANQPVDRFYLGGELIAEFRSGRLPAAASPPAAPSPRRQHVPEDWVASTTALFGETSLGLSTLPDGRTLRAHVEDSPTDWLGPHHLAAFGADTMLLVKLLHAGQRLPVHAHPDGEFAARHLGRAHGKVEAWHILVGGEVFLGLRRPVTRTALLDLVDRQDVEALLDLLHRRVVHPGDTVYVPAGTLHAIGAGLLLVELQQPEDLSILCEWRGFDLEGATDGHLGLGFRTALEAVDDTVLDPAAVDDLIRSDPSLGLLPARSAPYFRAERHAVSSPLPLDRGFLVMVVLSGTISLRSGAVRGESADPMDLPAGSTTVVPWAAGPLLVRGAGEILVCRPPLAR